MSVSERKAQRLRLPRLRELGRGGDPGAESGDQGQSPEYLVGAGRGQRRHPAPVRLSARSKLSRECEAWEAMCVGGLLQTDPQERAKTTTASSDCRPRPIPDPVVPRAHTHLSSRLQAPVLGRGRLLDGPSSPPRGGELVRLFPAAVLVESLNVRREFGEPCQLVTAGGGNGTPSQSTCFQIRKFFKRISVAAVTFI